MKYIYSVEVILSIIFAIVTFFIFSGDTSIIERVFYSLIVGVSSWLLLVVFKYTIIWFFKSITKK